MRQVTTVLEEAALKGGNVAQLTVAGLAEIARSAGPATEALRRASASPDSDIASQAREALDELDT